MNNTLLKEFEEYTFMIEDPFDRTYNPARQVKRYSELEEQYYYEMEEMIHSLKIDRCLPENILYAP